MNNVEIGKLSMEELVQLHRNICKRIGELNRDRLFEKLQEFEIGDKVSFNHDGDIITGTVIRINRKSLSIKTNKGNWYVDPRNVTKISLSMVSRWC